MAFDAFDDAESDKEETKAQSAKEDNVEEEEMQYSEEAIRAATVGMTELEKEQFIADVEEKKQRHRERELIKQKLQESRAQSDKRSKRKIGSISYCFEI